MPANPYATVRNPYAPGGGADPWFQWQQPNDATTRSYYTDHPQEAYQQFNNAFGAPGGNLQRFMQHQFGEVWANYIKQSEQAGSNSAGNFQFTDTLTPMRGAQMQQQWQAQTPQQRGEQYATLSAGRRV